MESKDHGWIGVWEELPNETEWYKSIFTKSYVRFWSRDNAFKDSLHFLHKINESINSSIIDLFSNDRNICRYNYKSALQSLNIDKEKGNYKTRVKSFNNNKRGGLELLGTFATTMLSVGVPHLEFLERLNAGL